MDGLRGEDLIFNNRANATSINRSYIAHAVDTTVSGFDLANDDLFVMTPPLDRPGNYSGYEFTHIADFNGDGRDDIMWQNIDNGGNNYYFAFGTESGLDLGGNNRNKAPYFRNFGGSWGIYTSLAGDANGDGRADLVEPRQKSTFDIFGIYFGQGSDTGGSIIGSHRFESHNDTTDDAAIKDLLGTDTALSPDMALADVNGDGSQDLIIYDLGKRNILEGYIGVGLSIPGGAGFTFNRATQALPNGEDWAQYRLLVGDFNGDLNDDVVWIKSSTTHSVFVGIARSQ